MDHDIIELALFKLKPGQSIEAITDAANATTGFLAGRNGFVRRLLSQTPQTEQWADIVLWETLHDAQEASTAFMQDSRCQGFLAMIDPDSLSLQHLHTHIEF